MVISPALHFEDESLMTKVQRFQSTLPAEDFWVRAVPLPVTCQNDPDRVQFPMLAQEVCAAETMRVDVPDSHGGSEGCRSGSYGTVAPELSHPQSGLIREPRYLVRCSDHQGIVTTSPVHLTFPNLAYPCATLASK